METQIIDGKKLRGEILGNVKEEVARLPSVPVFCDVLVGKDPASVQYVNMKKARAEECGMVFREASFGESVSTEELKEEIQKLNQEKNMCGIIVQLPLPPHIDKQEILNSIDPDLDVDCLGGITSLKFYEGNSSLKFPTALACVHILDSLNLSLNDKNIVILGKGMLVGRPVEALLRQRGLAPISLDRKTANKEELIKNADVIISGMGEGKYLTGDMIKKGAVIIDAGTSEENGAIIGDVDLESVRGVASVVSPVPGGVGPVTVAMLFSNVLAVAKKKMI